MKILEAHILRGPNCWSISHHRLIVMHMDMNTGEKNDLSFIHGVRDKLSAMFDAGFIRDFEEGLAGSPERRTIIGYTFALVAIYLQREAGAECSYKAVEIMDGPPIMQVVFEYADMNVGMLVAGITIKIIESLLRKEDYDISNDVRVIQGAWENANNYQLTASIVDEAIRRKIPCIQLNGKMLVQLGYGASQKRILRSTTGDTSSIGVKIAGNKELSKELLRSFGVPVPAGKLIFRENSLAGAIKSIGYPVVLKPAGGNNGRGVSVNVTGYEDALAAFQAAKNISGAGGVIVEKFITGSDYRILVINYQFVAAAQRTPAMVTGDGVSTIHELIAIVNSDPRRGAGHSKPLTIITVDDEVRSRLQRNGLSLDSVLPSGKPMFLKSVANLSAGGTSTDVTDLVHPDNIFMAERITRIVGLDVCGLDIISPDIGVPFNLNGGSVVEVNSSPGFRLHMEPAEGKPRNVAGSVIDMLFPAGSPSRIPIIAVTGAYNKMNTCDLIAQMMSKAGYKVGCATSGGVHIRNFMVLQGDAAYYNQAEMVLKDPTIDLAVFECALPGILGTGLAFHNCDIGIVTGLDPGGADAREREMRRAAAVVPGCVLPSGYAILNADDEIVYRMHKGLECKIAYFSMFADNPYIAGHIQNGGSAAIVDDGHITVCEGLDKIRIMRVSDIAGIGAGAVAAGDPFLMRHILAFVLAGSIFRIPVEVIREMLTGSGDR